MIKMTYRNTKGQASLEMLIVFGLLVIGAVLFSMFFITHMNKNSEKQSGLQDQLLSDFNSTLWEYENPYKICNNNGACDANKGENENNCPNDCLIFAPISDKPSGAYSLGTEIQLSTQTNNATIYYTTNGTEPTQQSTEYSSAIILNAGFVLKAIACREDIGCSLVSEYTYTIASISLSIFPDSGNRDYNQAIIIQSQEPGVTIKYTTDGTEPTQNSTTYSSTIYLLSPMTLKARGFKTGFTPSSIVSAVYQVILPTPVAVPISGVYPFNTLFKLSSIAPQAIIKYTTDGTNPISGATYSQPLIINTDFVLKAISTNPTPGYINSNILTNAYSIENANSYLEFVPEKSRPYKQFTIKYITNLNLGTSPVFNISTESDLGGCVFNSTDSHIRISAGLTEYSFPNNSCRNAGKIRIIFSSSGNQIVDYLEKDYNITYKTLEFTPDPGITNTRFNISYYIPVENIYAEFGSMDKFRELTKFSFDVISGCDFNNTPEYNEEGNLLKIIFVDNTCSTQGTKNIVLSVLKEGNLIDKIESNYLIQ